LHVGAVARYAARRVPIDDVHDVLSETFLTAWRKLDAVPEDAVPWLFATARRHIANRNRSTRRRQALRLCLINAHALGDAPQPEAEPVEIDGDIVDAIHRLPAGEREALMLVAWDGLDPKRAAIAAGCSGAALRVRLHRARSRLKRELASISETTAHASLPRERLENVR
jgi:RNA polymerase sigma-70 factor (ECF subfamily)